jgi:hypothetical protein
MANAYTVMAQAKRQGAEIKAIEEYNEYKDAIEAETARANKAGWLGKLGGGIFGSIASVLTPALMTALAVPTGGLGAMLLGGGLVGGGISRGATEIGDFLARQWGMGGKGRGKKMRDVTGMGALSGPYGQRFFSQLQQQGEGLLKQSKQSISESLDIENLNRTLSSIFSGLTAAGKVRGGLETIGADATLGERMMASMRGKTSEGYRLGAKETGDWWTRKADLPDIEALSQALTGVGAKSTEGFEQSILDALSRKKEKSPLPGSSFIDSSLGMDSKASDLSRAYTNISRSSSPVDYSSYFEGIDPEKSFSPLQIAESNKSIASVMKATPDTISSQYPHFPSHMDYTKAGGELDYDMWNQTLEMMDYGGRAPKTIEELLRKLSQLQTTGEK